MKNNEEKQIPQKNYTAKKILPAQVVTYRVMVEWVKKEPTRILDELQKQIIEVCENKLFPFSNVAVLIPTIPELQHDDLLKLQEDYNKVIKELNEEIEGMFTKFIENYGLTRIKQYELPKIEPLNIIESFEKGSIYGYIYSESYTRVNTQSLLNNELKKEIEQQIQQNPCVSKEVLDLLDGGQCYAWSVLHCWNNRQKDINNTKDNPTADMYNVLNNLVKKYDPTKVDGITIFKEYEDKKLDEQVQIILNYIVAIQLYEYSVQELKAKIIISSIDDIDEQEDWSIYDNNSKWGYIIRKQGFQLVNLSGDKKIKEIIIPNISGENTLDDLVYLIHPGVLIDLTTDTKSGCHVMSCYMNHDGVILFYDCNFEEELSFTDVKNLITYLREEHKVKYTECDDFIIFPDDNCRIKIISVNSNNHVQQQIQKDYAEIQKILWYVNEARNLYKEKNATLKFEQFLDGKLQRNIKSAKFELKELLNEDDTEDAAKENSIKILKDEIDVLEKLLNNNSYLQNQSDILRKNCKEDLKQVRFEWIKDQEGRDNYELGIKLVQEVKFLDQEEGHDTQNSNEQIVENIGNIYNLNTDNIG